MTTPKPRHRILGLSDRALIVLFMVAGVSLAVALGIVVGELARTLFTWRMQ